MRGTVLLVLVGLCCLPIVAAAAAPSMTGGPGQLTDPTPDTGTVIEIGLRADGDAVWTVSTVVALNGTNETKGFRTVGRSFEERETDGGAVPTFRRLADAGGETTGRTMRIRNVSRSWRIVQPPVRANGTTLPPSMTGDRAVGVLVLQFEWSRFARTDGDRVAVGDTFDAADGFLPRLYRGQTLLIHAPRNYSVESAQVGPRNGTLRWDGPVTFGDGALDARFAKSGGPGPDPELPQSYPIGVAVALIIAGIALALHVRRDGDESPEDGGSGGEATADAANDPRGPDEPIDEDAVPDDPVGDPFAGIDETLLSDAERVERILDAAGGRLRQSQIVDATGWSNAKVSQVLSDMADDGRVDKLRIGRENLITLPDAAVLDGSESTGSDGEPD